MFQKRNYLKRKEKNQTEISAFSLQILIECKGVEINSKQQVRYALIRHREASAKEQNHHLNECKLYRST